jgi:DNA-directed RNA polymerase specialized sigma24 family protein
MSRQRPSRAFVRKAHRGFNRMTDLQRELFLAMRFEEGVTRPELAQRYGISEGQVDEQFVEALIIFTRSIRESEPWWGRLWPW